MASTLNSYHNYRKLWIVAILPHKHTFDLRCPCLGIGHPAEVFYAMLRQILARADEVLHVLAAVAPGDQLAIHLPAHLQAVDNLNLEGQRYWEGPTAQSRSFSRLGLSPCTVMPSIVTNVDDLLK